MLTVRKDQRSLGKTINASIFCKTKITTEKERCMTVSRPGSLAAGAHPSFPDIGRLTADGSNVYTWVPVQFAPVK